jgi:hypothetical protein
LLSVALKFDGQSAEVVMAAGDLLPDPPVGAGAVVLVVDGLVVVVVDDAVPAHGLVTRRDRPTTITTAMAMLMLRRSPFLRLAAFSSASRRAWRPAF